MKKTETMEDFKRMPAQPLLLSIQDVAASLGLGRSKVYELIAKEGLPVIRFGRSVRVSAASLQKWVEQPFPMLFRPMRPSILETVVVH